MISIIIPVYNEDESLAILHGEIINVAQLHQLDVEILFVDDGSKDNSWDKICELISSSFEYTGNKVSQELWQSCCFVCRVSSSKWGYFHHHGCRPSR